MDRSQFKGATLGSIKDEQENAKKAIPTSDGEGRAGFHKIEDGENWRRIAPAHKPDQPAYCAKSTVFLECEVDELDKEGNPTGRKELKTKNIFIATQHSNVLKEDPILLYISFVQKRANDEIQDKDERQKFLYPINGWRGKDGKWNWGIKPSIEYICYAWDKNGKLGRETLYSYMLDSMKKISVQQAPENTEIIPDIFTDPDEGYPLIITKGKNDKGKIEYTISCELPSKEKRESWDDFFKRTRITDEQFVDFMKRESLYELYKNVYTMRDFEMAIDGLMRFDKRYKYNIFENEEFLEKIANLKKQVPAYTPKQYGASSEERSNDENHKEEVSEKNIAPDKKHGTGIKSESSKEVTSNNLPAPIPAMKRQLSEYIKDNYGDDYKLPELSREQLIEWYKLAKNGDELPFDEIELKEIGQDNKITEPKEESKIEKEEEPEQSNESSNKPEVVVNSKQIDPDLQAQIDALRKRRQSK